jgi:hypothetical protein
LTLIGFLRRVVVWGGVATAALLAIVALGCCPVTLEEASPDRRLTARVSTQGPLIEFLCLFVSRDRFDGYSFVQLELVDNRSAQTHTVFRERQPGDPWEGWETPEGIYCIRWSKDGRRVACRFKTAMGMERCRAFLITGSPLSAAEVAPDPAEKYPGP